MERKPGQLPRTAIRTIAAIRPVARTLAAALAPFTTIWTIAAFAAVWAIAAIAAASPAATAPVAPISTTAVAAAIAAAAVGVAGTGFHVRLDENADGFFPTRDAAQSPFAGCHAGQLSVVPWDARDFLGVHVSFVVKRHAVWSALEVFDWLDGVAVRVGCRGCGRIAVALAAPAATATASPRGAFFALGSTFALGPFVAFGSAFVAARVVIVERAADFGHFAELAWLVIKSFAVVGKRFVAAGTSSGAIRRVGRGAGFACGSRPRTAVVRASAIATVAAATAAARAAVAITVAITSFPRFARRFIAFAGGRLETFGR